MTDIEFNKEYKRLRLVIRDDCDDSIKKSARLEMAKRWLLTCDIGYISEVYNSLGIPDTHIHKFKDMIDYIYMCDSLNTAKSNEYYRNISDVRDKLNMLMTLPVVWYCACNDTNPNTYLRELYSSIDKLLSDDIFNHVAKVVYSFYTVFIGSIADLSESIKEYTNLIDYINSEKIDSIREFCIFENKIKAYIKSLSDVNTICEIMQEELSTLSTSIDAICSIYNVNEVYSKPLKAKLERLESSMKILKEKLK